MAAICRSRELSPIPMVIGKVDAITSARDNACRKVPGEGVAVTNKKSMTFQVCHFLPADALKLNL